MFQCTIFIYLLLLRLLFFLSNNLVKDICYGCTIKFNSKEILWQYIKLTVKMLLSFMRKTVNVGNKWNYYS